MSSFAFGVELGKAKQIIVALITTAFKVLLSVAKANSGFSGHKLHAGNVYDLFLNVLVHIIPHRHIKKGAQPKPRTEKRRPQVVAKRTYTPIDVTPSNGSRIFTKWICLMVCTKKGMIIP